MDLTKEYPRSVHEKWQGVVQLGRTIDKGRAVAHGNIGEYHYNCPMDQAVLGFLGINHERLLDAIRNAKGDVEIEAFTRPFIEGKSRDDSSAGTANGYRASRKANRVRRSWVFARRSRRIEPMSPPGQTCLISMKSGGLVRRHRYRHRTGVLRARRPAAGCSNHPPLVRAGNRERRQGSDNVQ